MTTTAKVGFRHDDCNTYCDFIINYPDSEVKFNICYWDDPKN